MDVLLTDICARTLIILPAAGNTDDGVLKILDEHQDKLVRPALTHEWLRQTHPILLRSGIKTQEFSVGGPAIHFTNAGPDRTRCRPGRPLPPT